MCQCASKPLFQRYATSIVLFFLFSITTSYTQSLSLSQTVSDLTPETDEVFEYIISVSCNSTTANCNNTVVSGTLPEELDFTSFSNPLPAGVASATYDIVTRYYEVTFNDGPGNSLAQGSTIQFSLQVLFPGGTVETSVATNTVNATSTNATNASATASATVDVNNWVIPPANFPASKRGDDEQLPGGQQYWQVRIGNISFQTIDNYTVTDQIPSLTTLTQVRTPEIPYINHPARLFYERSDNLGVWNLWQNFNLNSREVLYVTGLGLPPGVEVSQVQIDFGTMSPSALYNTQRYNDGFDTGLILYATVDNSLADGVTYQNCANYSGTIDGVAETDVACLTTTINSGIAVNEVRGDSEFFDMTENNISVANIGDTIKVGWTYYSEPEMTNDILGGVMSLVLPPGMTYVPGTFADNWTCTAFDGEVPVIQLDNATDGRQIVRFVNDASFGNEFNIESNGYWDGCGFFIDVVIGNSTIEGDNTSEYYFNATGSTHDNCGTLDVDNILNGYAPDYCQHNTTLLVARAPGSAGIRAEKEVIGTLDASYSQYPATGTTVPGGLSNYRITLTNPNATPIDNIEVIDILPFISDNTILDESTSRFSEWTPNLAAPITAPTGVTVFYTTVPNPCRDELAGSNPTPFPTGCNTPAWSAVAPSDITDVTALKFDLFGITLNQNDDVVLEFEMRAPVNAPTAGEVSWNSFAYVAENATTNNPLLPTEAIKVGIETIPGTVPIGGDFVWDDLDGNGLQDSGEPGIDGVRIALIKDTNGNGNLDVGDVEYTWTISANGGQYIFSDFPIGNYFIQFSNFPSGYVETHQDIGSNEGLDSDGATTDLIVFGPTTDRSDIDFGLYNGVLPPLWSCTTGLLTNSEFESNFTNWFDFGNTSITSDAYVNGRAMLINGGQGGRGQVLNVTAGQTYTLSFYAKSTGPEAASAGFNVKDVNNNNIYSIARGVYENVYEYHSITMTIPENGVRLEVFGWKNSGSGAAYFDAFCLELVNDICGSAGESNTDNDGICDRYDIDDDNDGIRDIDESMCNGNWQELAQWTHNTPGNTGDPEILYPAGIASAGLEGYGSGITATLTTTYVLMDGVDQLDLPSAILDDDYLEYSITTQNNIPAIYLDQFRMTKHGFVSLGEEGNYGYDFSILISDDGFATSSVISDIFTVDPNVDPDFVTLFQEADNNFYYLKPSSTYTFRIFFYNKTTSSLVRALYDDFTIEAQVCDQVWDTDDDGYSNSEDLDSDNDGLTDLQEAGHPAADANNDGIIDGANTGSGINGFFDALETTADIGDINYTISDSEPTGDGIYDPYELDSDDDGCYDGKEENVTDPDDDGLVGTGVPSVLSNGLVNGHTYAVAPNNFWQDAALIKCLDVTGRIFEDINYGGGVGRDYAAANTSAVSSGWATGVIAVDNVRVELYDNSGAYVASSTTDASGQYTFTDVGTGSYSVRAVNQTVPSNRGSNSTGETIIPSQTYRHTGAVAVTNEVGGFNPALVDAGLNTTNSNISTLYTGSTTVQSLSNVTIGTTNFGGVDFGFNFDVIVNINENGQGSLNQFVLNSNELDNTNLDQEDNPTGGVSFTKDLEWETSIFMIPGSGVHTIPFANAIERIEDAQTHLTGYTQLGSAQGTNAGRTITVELDGLSSSNIGVAVAADRVHISGLSIRSFLENISARSAGIVDLFIWGNYLGLEADGLTPDAANTGYGIYMRYIGDAIIGTDGDAVNDSNEGNVIADSYDGIISRDSGPMNIAGNIVGMDKTGTVDLGNRFNGIYLLSSTAGSVIGFNENAINTNADDFRNYLSGGGNDGIRISNSDDNVVAGNYIGTNFGATAAIANGNYGIQLQGTSSNNVIGTNANGDDDLLERNIISGNGSGLRFLGGGTGDNNVIAGNWFGTDVTGLSAIPNGHGISLNGNYTNSVIGTNGNNVNDAVEGNVISGNINDGIRLSDIDGVIVAGNKIGLGADGTTSLGNGQRGMLIATTASNNVIGYTPTMLNSDELIVGNFIKNNADSGIGISGSGTQNRISRNQLENNGGLGIDLDYDGVTSNDNGDGDTGPNNLYNFPVLTSVMLLNNSLTITGFAPSGSNIEFFIADAGPNPSPLPSGYTTSFGEGSRYLFTVQEGGGQDAIATTGVYNNDGTGVILNRTQSRFSFTIDVSSMGITDGLFLTSTATDSSNNTSEFSGVTEIILNCGTAIMNPHVMYFGRNR